MPDMAKPKAIALMAGAVLAGLLPVVLLADAPRSPATRPAGPGERPEGAPVRLGSDRFTASYSVGRVALAPDGNTLAAADGRERITLWDAATGRRLRDFPVPPGEERRLRAMRFDANGHLVCLGIKGDLTVIDPATGKVLHSRTVGGRRGIAYGSLSADGMRVGIVRPKQPGVLLDRRSGRVVAQIEEAERSHASAAVISGDGNVLAVAYPRKALRIVVQGQEPYAVEKLPIPLRSRVALSHDGAQVALAREDGSVLVYDLASGELRTLHAGAAGPCELAFSTDGSMLVGAAGVVWSTPPTSGL